VKARDLFPALLVGGLLTGMPSTSAVPQGVHPCDSLSVDERCLFATVVNECEVVVSARVLGVRPEPDPAGTVGDWVFVVTGHRFGLPDLHGRTEFRLQRLAGIKGSVESEFSACTLPKVDMDPGVICDEFFPSIPEARPIEGHDYLICARRSHSRLEIVYVSDVAQWPTLAEEVARYVRENPQARPRRRTTRSSARTRASRRLLSERKRLAARRAAERVRWTGHLTQRVFQTQPQLGTSPSGVASVGRGL